jgi:hypothetical protein
VRLCWVWVCQPSSCLSVDRRLCVQINLQSTVLRCVFVPQCVCCDWAAARNQGLKYKIQKEKVSLKSSDT